MLRKLILTIAVLAAIGGSIGHTAQANTNQHSLASIIKWERAQIKLQKRIVHEKSVWRTLTNTPTYTTAIVIPLAERQLHLHQAYLHKLQIRLAANIKEYKRQTAVVGSPRLSAWLCIHSYEGSWTDSGAPYYGGLQMDYGFMSTYGPELLKSKGTADHWTPAEQIMVADRAYESGRGFWPWPNTARFCGLI